MGNCKAMALIYRVFFAGLYSVVLAGCGVFMPAKQMPVVDCAPPLSEESNPAVASSAEPSTMPPGEKGETSLKPEGRAELPKSGTLEPLPATSPSDQADSTTSTPLPTAKQAVKVEPKKKHINTNRKAVKRTPPKLPPSAVASLAVIGEVEYATVFPEGLRQKARIDTGAQTSSVGVTQYSLFERDGKKWVLFTINETTSDTEHTFKRKLVRRVRIKRHDAESERRPVVEMEVKIGDLKQLIEVTLSKRDNFEYPVLIGRNFLEGAAVVDVSRKFLTLDSK